MLPYLDIMDLHLV